MTQRTQRKALRATRRASGLCQECGRSAPLPALVEKVEQLCDACYCRKVSKFNLGTGKHWRVLRDKFHAQEARCPYTGDVLVLGLNATVDHILPISRYPDRRNDPTNVEWVVNWVNLMKGDATPDEFVDRMRRILVYRSR